MLEARAAHEVDELPKSFLKRLLDVVRSMFETMADAEAAGDEESAVAVDGKRDQDDLDDLFEFHEEGEDEMDDETPRVKQRAKRRPATDCPVTCSADAIVVSIPHALTKLATDVPSAVKLRRVWTTMCCIAVLERLVVCWLWGDGEAYPPEERCVLLHDVCCVARSLVARCSTIVDAGREWIEAQAAEWPKLEAVLADDKMMKAARRTTKYWNRAWEQRVTELRASPALRHQMTRSHVHRTAIGVTRAMIANVRAILRGLVIVVAFQTNAPRACPAERHGAHVFGRAT